LVQFFILIFQVFVEVVVTGIGLLSALGPSLEKSWLRLMADSSAIQVRQPFPELPPRPLGLVGQTPAQLMDLIERVVPMALKDADLAAPLPDCGVVLGSSRSQQARWEQYGVNQYLLHQNISGNHCPETYLEDWLDSLPHMGAIATARLIGSTGIVLAPMASCATGIWSLARAFELIQGGECQRVLVGAVEAPVTPLSLAGFAKMGALAKTGCYPFDREREGLVLGEGAAVFVLETAELAAMRSAKIYGQILGFGITNDACYLNSPEPDGITASHAIEQCLDRSQLSGSDIDYIHAHGTSTILNDRFEANLIQKVFSPKIPISSTKGATGHTLGASGALGAAFCLMALNDGFLPPCVGLKDPEFDLNFVTTASHSDLENVLCLSFGFGGQNGAIALRKWLS
jgi:3-oxoacyl-[acyl-carrier-protein] synthase II